jgi:hypothetical protein
VQSTVTVAIQRQGQLQFPLDVGVAVFQTVPQSGDERFGADDQFW